MKRTSLALLLLVATVFHAQTQGFGGFSPGISWNQINTKPVRVIFPDGLEKEATRVASLIQYMDQNSRKSVGDSSKKLELVLNNQGIIPNGFVTLQPYRSEFFTTPLQQSHALGTLPWLDLLAIHEYRHALQYANSRKGITKIGTILTGESFWGLALNLSTPDWYFEGDAVVAETALTQQGRGRIPSFYQGFKSLYSSGKRYSYEKVRNGSLKHEVPDHYRLGYLLCNYGRDQYGDDLWMNVMDRTVRYKGIIYPFSKAIKHFTELNSTKFYQEAFEHYEQTWEAEIPYDRSENSTLNKNFRSFTNYSYPQWDKTSNSWLAIKSSYKKTAALIQFSEKGKEKKLVNMGIHIDAYYSVNQNYFAWTEISGDARFSTKSFSDIVIYDRESNKKSFLTQNQRLVSPALSSVDDRIVAIESAENGVNSLVFVDINSGEITKRLPNKEEYYYTYPQWSSDGKSIISSARTSSGAMGIYEVDPETSEVSIILHPGNFIIGKVFPTEKAIFFSATFDGIDNIYSIDQKSRVIAKHTETPFGAYEVAVDDSGNKLCYRAYFHTGSELKTKDLAPIQIKNIQLKNLDQIDAFQPDFVTWEGGAILDKVPFQKHKIKKYSPILHSLKFHSWSPIIDISKIGLNLVSDNVLGNLHFEGGYNYFLNEQSGGYSFSALYGQYLPIFSLGFSQGFRNPGFTVDDREKVWESTFNAGVQVPLDFSKGMFNRSVLGAVSLQNTSVPSQSGLSNLSSHKINFTSVGVQSKFLLSKIRAQQNISSPLGIGGEMLLNRSFSGIKASQLQLYFDASVRGILPNHNLVGGFSFKSESLWNAYQFMDLNVYPRGYQILRNNWMATWQINYHFPLLYPDIGFGGLVYFLRVRANMFADLGFGEILNPTTNYEEVRNFSSIGAELIFDMKLIRLVPMSLGLRLSALGNTDLHKPGRSSYFEVFFPILRL